ncbi:TetR/AcrR family transcriptional regulator [Sphaerisporangium fuscum]|uniref:TetR/AcrR family transcriptional regulator n=1 Tax=Sphaerisporangium fuscum TaxID=2835868 RepID=UPI001BDD0E3A|nr:TetR/AcrR family transcriptional regulator [Sphaerisporangium fuscum]
MTDRPVPLPLLGQSPAERADAARNRRKILEAAARLVAADGVKALSVDEVARAADVGVGTVYRRFGDRAGLIYALLDDCEREFQAAFLSGPPPLGPGAPPGERLRAFLHALVDRAQKHQQLLLTIECHTSAAKYRSVPYSVHHTHVSSLLGLLRPGADVRHLADALLAPLATGLLAFQRDHRGMTAEQIKAGLDDFLGWNPATGRCATIERRS